MRVSKYGHNSNVWCPGTTPEGILKHPTIGTPLKYTNILVLVLIVSFVLRVMSPGLDSPTPLSSGLKVDFDVDAIYSAW